MENPIKMDDLGGFPPIFGNIHVVVSVYPYHSETPDVKGHLSIMTIATARPVSTSGSRKVASRKVYWEVKTSMFQPKSISLKASNPRMRLFVFFAEL